MNEEQRAKLLEILIETWNRQQSADEAFDEIDYLIGDYTHLNRLKGSIIQELILHSWFITSVQQQEYRVNLN